MHVINILGGGGVSSRLMRSRHMMFTEMTCETFASTLSASWINDAVVLGGARTFEKIARKRAAATDAERPGSHHTSPSV